MLVFIEEAVLADRQCTIWGGPALHLGSCTAGCGTSLGRLATKRC